ncbi:MAG: thioredoxin domain-containing protein [Candidatus Sericytochromatia bacterium]|nr:thioredoxin domain-containing protein [Candidatus Tanganyikabacteria bacterium]
MPNRLASEKSPYLRQHANNPVDWYPWGPEAWERARREDKPVLLSVGYSACHWCHVMAHESFEDAAIAALMNEHFVNVKVDREERPDVDQVYMAAVQAMAGQGGWPMTVFCTAAGRPYFGGTYFPPADRFGRPGFPRVLLGAARAYREHRDDCERNADTILDQVRHNLGIKLRGAFGPATLHEALARLQESFDPDHGGFGGAPKFPQAMALEFVLRTYHRLEDFHARRMLVKSLDEMAAGGIYDHLGGGFHRYSTDARWLVPHFEKMLYDNALLARLYFLAGQRLGEPRYLVVARETLEWVMREMTDPAGGWYSALDADSEGEEGRFYVWTYPEILTLLGSEAAEPFLEYYGVTMNGNWEGRSILCARPGTEPPAALADARSRLLAERENRVRPGRDDKIIAAWNGLMLEAFADAARILGDRVYRQAAEACADFLLTRMRQDDDLLRIWNGGQPAIPGFLEDHACVASGLLALYAVAFEDRWLLAARDLADRAIAQFWDEGAGEFHDAGPRHDTLVIRARDTYDNATPAGNSAIVDVLLRLHALTGDSRYREIADRVLGDLAGLAARVPVGYGRFLCAADFALAPVVEVAIAGDPASAATEALIDVARAGYAPYRVLALRRPGQEPAVPLLEGRDIQDGRPAAYVCRDFACEAPVADPAALAELLRNSG